MVKKDSLIAKRYAKALFQVLVEMNAFKLVSKDLEHLKASLLTSSTLRAFINNPTITIATTLAVLKDLITQGRYTEITANFLNLLAVKKRFNLFLDILHSFQDLMAEREKKLSGIIISAQKLEKNQITEIQSILKAKSGYKISLKNQIDPSILGGFVIKVASYFIDSSLQTKLVHLNTQLKVLLDEVTSI